MARCKGCGAQVLWARTAKGKPMPVDMAPAPGGNVKLEDRAGGELAATVLTPIELALAKSAGETLYTAHFVNCPYADMFRKERS